MSKYLPKKAVKRLRELAMMKRSITDGVEFEFDEAVSLAEIHEEMRDICYKYYPKKKRLFRYQYWRDGGYLRTKRDQDYQWKKTHHFKPPMIVTG